MNYECKLLLLWKLGKGWPQRSWWGEKTISGWWELFSFISKDLHPFPITFCLKLYGKGPQRFLGQQETMAQIQKDWNFLLFYQQEEDIFMKLPSNIDIVVLTPERSGCADVQWETRGVFLEAPHHNTASLSTAGATLCCILPMAEPEGSHPLTLQSLHTLGFAGGTWNSLLPLQHPSEWLT